MSHWCHTGVTLVSHCETDRTKCPQKQNHAEKNNKTQTLSQKILKQLQRSGSRFKMFGEKSFRWYAGSFIRFLGVVGLLLVVLEALRVIEEVLWVFVQVLDL